MVRGCCRAGAAQRAVGLLALCRRSVGWWRHERGAAALLGCAAGRPADTGAPEPAAGSRPAAAGPARRWAGRAGRRGCRRRGRRMSVSDDFRAAVELLRGWGFHVTEWNGCYGRSNGGGWSAGRPVGHVNHHYVCSLNPDQGYINNLVANLANGSVVNWFADVHGVAYLIGTGPMNHAGTGNQSVLDRTRMDAPPPSNPASSAGSISGNSHYSGTEAQHPGDSTPWPTPMLDVVVAINAAEFLVWNYTENRAINHSEWSNRKIDMSAGGGVNSDGWSAAELRRRVAAQMTGTTTGDEFDMATLDELRTIVGEEIDKRLGTI